MRASSIGLLMVSCFGLAIAAGGISYTANDYVHASAIVDNAQVFAPGSDKIRDAIAAQLEGHPSKELVLEQLQGRNQLHLFQYEFILKSATTLKRHSLFGFSLWVSAGILFSVLAFWFYKSRMRELEK